MIIGNNNYRKNSNFINTNHNINQNNPEKNDINNNITQNNNKIPSSNTQNIMQNSNIMNSEDMKNRAFAMLNERLKNGTITIDEFNKKCKQLGKQK